jgi:Tol biopolymer transport system component
LEVMNSDGSGHRVLCTFDRCDHAQGIAAPAWSPDGELIAFSNQGVGDFRELFLPPSWISLIRADGTGLRKLTEQNCPFPSGGRQGCSFFDSSPAWSPDGAWVAFRRIGTGAPDRSGPSGPLLEVVRPDGTSLRTLDTCPTSRRCGGDALAWSPDGKRIASAGADNSAIQLVRLDGSGRVTLKTCGPQGCVDPSAAVWSPDGNQLAFLDDAVRSSVYAIRLDGSGLHRIATDVQCCMAWLPASSGIPVGSPPRPTPTASATLGPEPGLIAFAWDRASPNEDMAMDIYTIRNDGSHLTRLTDTTGFDGNPVWSPDGTRILFRSERPGEPNTNVFVMNADGSDQRALTSFAEGAGPARWAPDGHQIVFSGGVGGEQAIFVMAVSGGTPHQLTQPNRNGGEFDPAWSPDGTTIAFSDELPGGAAIYLMAPDGSNLRRLANLPGSMEAARWLPGGWLAFSWFTSAGRSTYEIRVDGTGLRRLQDPAASSGYGTSSPDGTEIVFSRQFGLQREALFRANADGSASERITQAPGTYSDPAWQPTP